MTRVAVRIDPLDTLFFRGGRPFTASLPGESTLPSPQVFAGLVRSFLLEANHARLGAMRGAETVEEAFAAAGCPWLAEVACRGPFPAIVEGKRCQPVVPAPANLRCSADGKSTIDLLPLRGGWPGWEPPAAGGLPLGATRTLQMQKEPPAFLTFRGLGLYLGGQPVPVTEVLKPSRLYELDSRVSIQIDPATGVAADTAIYSTRKLVLARDVCLYGEVMLPDDQARHLENAVSRWGGERHHVTILRTEAVTWPEVSGTATRVLLLTPTFEVAANHLPAALVGTPLRGAATTRPVAISGWDLARGGPKPTRFGVGGGSVFFLEGEAPLPAFSSGEDARLGYGFCLKGTWNYAK